MKKFTDSKQTETLISLGFPLPSTVVDLNDCYIVDRYGAQEVECDECNYSIGELLEILDKYQDKLSMVKTEHRWFINYHTKNIELIDSLFDILVKLKEEGVI